MNACRLRNASVGLVSRTVNGLTQVSRIGILGFAFGLSLVSTAQAECRWKLFPTVNPQRSGNQLVGVAGTADNDVWETGAAFLPRRSLGYALHWDGTAWTVFTQADPTKHGGQLSGVAALAKADVWTVGQQYAAPNYRGRRAVANHWNGESFSVVPVPQLAAQETFLYGIAAFGSSDVWSVGGALPSGGLQQTYVIHWDGKSWKQIAAPNVPNSATNLDAVAGTSSNDVWTVGGSQANTSSPFRTLAEHWNGTAWSVVPTPNVNARTNVFNAVVALSPTDAWAIGDYSNGKALSPLAEHWDGTAWHIVLTPNSGTLTAFLFGATAVAPNDVLAVGEIGQVQGGVAAYVLRWNGIAWTHAPTPNKPHRLATLFNAVASIPGGSVWAVGGDANAKIVIDTVTEVRSCR